MARFFFHFPTKEHVLAELGHREEIRLAGELDRFLSTPRDLQAALAPPLASRRLSSDASALPLFKDLLAGLLLADALVELRLWPDHPFIRSGRDRVRAQRATV